MTLALELSADEEARLEAAALLHGTDAATYAKRLVTEHLPAVALISVEEFDRIMSEIARPLPSIPHEKQTREYIYED
ncbi:MAG: hypothetical protein ACLQVD_07215 [Capsulimonadaceae bacterium]